MWENNIVFLLISWDDDLNIYTFFRIKFHGFWNLYVISDTKCCIYEKLLILYLLDERLGMSEPYKDQIKVKGQ